jgi:hypothetical protein
MTRYRLSASEETDPDLVLLDAARDSGVPVITDLLGIFDAFRKAQEKPADHSENRSCGIGLPDHGSVGTHGNRKVVPTSGEGNGR